MPSGPCDLEVLFFFIVGHINLGTFPCGLSFRFGSHYLKLNFNLKFKLSKFRTAGLTCFNELSQAGQFAVVLNVWFHRHCHAADAVHEASDATVVCRNEVLVAPPGTGSRDVDLPRRQTERPHQQYKHQRASCHGRPQHTFTYNLYRLGCHFDRRIKNSTYYRYNF